MAALQKKVGLVLLALLCCAGCVRQAAHSELYSLIFKQESGICRGVDIGTPLDKVKQLEGATPKYDDDWGLVYDYSLGGKNRIRIEYLRRNPKETGVNAIVLNVLLEEKSVATDLFAEMEDDLRGRYGVADGDLGNLTWRQEETNSMVSLRMLDDKKSISLNFGALQVL